MSAKIETEFQFQNNPLFLLTYIPAETASVF